MNLPPSPPPSLCFLPFVCGFFMIQLSSLYINYTEKNTSSLGRMKNSTSSKQRSSSAFSSMRFSFSCSKCFSSSYDMSTDNPSMQGLQILQNVHAFSFNELKVATNGFRASNKIGEGGFGCVYKGILQDGRIVAIKMLSEASKQGDREFLSEIASVSNMNHENLVKLHGGCIDGPCKILVYDYMENGSLAQTLLGGRENRAKFKWETRREISLGIAQGIAYIHEEIKPHFVHRDIKASNILLDKNLCPKVSDFGLSKLFPENVTHVSTRVAGTLGYIAPEYAISGRLTRKTDIYSFGVLLLEIVTGRKAVDFDPELGEHYLVEKAWEMYKTDNLLKLVDPMLNGNFLETEAVGFVKIALLCVQEKCGLRPNMSTAIKMMRGEIDIHNTQMTQPGLIIDIMDVKIGQKSQSSVRSITNRCSPRLHPL